MYEVGEIVKVKTFMDGIVERRVTGSRVGTIYLCNESEFQAALKEGREPNAAGFPETDIVEKESQHGLIITDQEWSVKYINADLNAISEISRVSVLLSPLYLQASWFWFPLC
jgi:hypothetical protein